MSVEAIALVLNHSQARGTDKVVLIGIANHDGDGGAWPSIETLARYARVDRRNVQRAIENLVAAGELEVVANAGGTQRTRGDRRPNLYRILVRPEVSNESTEFQDVPPSLDGAAQTSPRDAADTERGGAGVVDGAALTPERGGADAARTVLEPSIEPPKEKTDAQIAFNAFWDAYPRKAAKVKTIEKWRKALEKPGIAADLLLERAQAYADDPNREAAYTMIATTWLNQERWNDPPLPAKPGRSSAEHFATVHDLFGGQRAVEQGP